jgi:hypothetical protein
MLWSQFSAILANFSAKELALFFTKTNVMIKFLQKLAVARAKNANIFAKFFGENIFKIVTSVPVYLCRRNFFCQRCCCCYS